MFLLIVFGMMAVAMLAFAIATAVLTHSLILTGLCLVILVVYAAGTWVQYTQRRRAAAAEHSQYRPESHAAMRRTAAFLGGVSIVAVGSWLRLGSDVPYAWGISLGTACVGFGLMGLALAWNRSSYG